MLKTKLEDLENLRKILKFSEKDEEFIENTINEEDQLAVGTREQLTVALGVEHFEEHIKDIFFDANCAFRKLENSDLYLANMDMAVMTMQGDELDFRKIAVYEIGYLPFAITREELRKQYSLTNMMINNLAKRGLLQHWCYSENLDFAVFMMTKDFRDRFSPNN